MTRDDAKVWGWFAAVVGCGTLIVAHPGFITGLLFGTVLMLAITHRGRT